MSDFIFPKGPKKKISAFIRVLNEEKFLEASVLSIIDFVDEILLIDSNSTDKTPDIIKKLEDEYPKKVVPLNYPFRACKVGREHFDLFIMEPDSERLLSNFYNWCLSKCSMPYAMKWDGDMIALDGLGESINFFRSSDHHVVSLFGYNIHPDMEHLIKIQKGTKITVPVVGGIPFSFANYIAPLTSPEKRIFIRKLYMYVPRYWWCEDLFSPFEFLMEKQVLEIGIPTYIHMKYCKTGTNFGSDLIHLTNDIITGDKVQPYVKEKIKELGLK